MVEFNYPRKCLFRENMLKPNFKLKKFVKSKLKSKIIFDKKQAMRLVDPSYYKAQARNMREYEFLEKEKQRLSTPKWEKVTNLLNYYREQGFTSPSSTGKTLLGMYNKNKAGALSNQQVKNQKLLSILSKPETLLLAYREIKGNKGALTQAAQLSKEDYNNLTAEQQTLYLKGLKLPDNISLYDIQLTCRLLRIGKYPWGSSSRVYFDKPGQPGKKRPITIPPFMDKVIQKAIELILHSIYEPKFEVTNRSFGFRPNKGTHDAMIALTSRITNGMRTAVEGDIQAAYDTVDRDILMGILGKSIDDRKFLSLIRDRLNYDYVEKETQARVRPTLGIPQGGIDSPYLFNIYMSELDNFINTTLTSYIDSLNTNLLKKETKLVNKDGTPAKQNKTGTKRIFNKQFIKTQSFIRGMPRKQKLIKNKLNKLPKQRSLPKVTHLRKQLFKLVKETRLATHTKNRLSSAPINKKILRIFYVRYADDWILLTNGDIQIANILKNKISEFLKSNLKLELSESKTLVTEITKQPAKFLGYEVRVSARGRLRRLPHTTTKFPVGTKLYKKNVLAKASGLLLWVQPDKQRMINRYHMKGLCSLNGFPKEIPWLSTLDAHAIIERFNSCLRGIANYYLPIIRNRGKIARWIYILRYSCLKTIAQKYRLSITKVFKRFGVNLHSKADQTISIRIEQKIKDKTYYKDWKLLTYKDLVNTPYKKYKKDLEVNFWDREKGKIGEYPLKTGKIPKVTNQDYLDKINWFSWRTTATFDMPCAYCGTDNEVQQHHIRHIRKRAYSLIPGDLSYQKILALRNRKQIPLCSYCHKNLVHGGKYNGPKLINLAPIKTLITPTNEKMLDNRVLHLESFVQPGSVHHAKSITEKGWKEKIINNLTSKKQTPNNI